MNRPNAIQLRLEYYRRNRQDAGLLIVTLLAMIVGGYGSFATKNLPSGILLTLMSALSLWLTEREYQFNRRENIHLPAGLVGFFENRTAARNNLSNYAEYIAQGRNQVFLVGLSCMYISVQIKEIVKRGARQGCAYHFLLPSGDYKDGIVGHFLESEYPTTYDSSIESIRVLSQTKEGIGKIEGRCYTKAFPTLGLMFIDPETENGRVLVELMPFGFDKEDRPSFELVRTANAGLFDALWSSYRDLWSDKSTRPAY